MTTVESVKWMYKHVHH